MDRQTGARLLQILGGSLLMLYGASLFVPTSTPDPVWVLPLELLVLSLFTGALISIAADLADSPLDSSHVRAVVRWTALGILIADGLVLLYLSHLRLERHLLPLDEVVDLLIFAAAWGSTSAAYMALQRARARHQFEEVTDQRDEFAFLNSVLRHNVLNSINIIQGTASMLAETATGETQRYLTIIERQSDSVATLIEQVRKVAIIQADGAEPSVMALAPLLSTAVDTARETFPDAEFDTEIPDGVSVQGTPLLEAAFENVLTNAVEHNDATSPRIAVEVTDREDAVVIEIADNGPGLPEEMDHDGIFDKESYSDSFGLHMVQEIVEVAGGQVTSRPNEPRGLVVAIELLKADADTSSAGM